MEVQAHKPFYGQGGSERLQLVWVALSRHQALGHCLWQTRYVWNSSLSPFRRSPESVANR